MLFAADSILDLPWQNLLAAALYAAVFIGGLITAVFTWRKHPPISLIVITAMAGLLWTYLNHLREQTLPDYDQSLEKMSEEDRLWHYWLKSVPYTVVSIMLAITALMGRRQQSPVIIARGEEAPHV